MAAEEVAGGLPHLADRLNMLFARVPRPGTNQRYTNERAAEELTAAGVSVSGAYLSLLRSGKKNNPTARLLAGIAELFQVPITYFFDADEAERITQQLDLVVALRNAGVQGIVSRAAGVSDAGIANLAAILEQIRKMEGLDDGGDSPSTHGPDSAK
ncbi:MAG TPA: helix-turn-helix domain-containing protein [Microlunatus sp.]|nr:helix-turn-helix domain-containing protein [Microlunatus sp.]